MRWMPMRCISVRYVHMRYTLVKGTPVRYILDARQIHVTHTGPGGGLGACLGNTRQIKSAPSSPSRSPTPCRFKHSHLASRVSQGERWVPKWTPFFTLFWVPSCATASSRPCGSDRQEFKVLEAPSCLQRVFSRFFFPPSPSFLDYRWVKNNRDPENFWYEVILLPVKEPV